MAVKRQKPTIETTARALSARPIYPARVNTDHSAMESLQPFQLAGASSVTRYRKLENPRPQKLDPQPAASARIAQRTPKLQALCCLLVILSALCVLTGCGRPARKVMTTWRGDFTGEKRINERVILSPPMIESITGSQEPGVFQIGVGQKELTTFDLEESYEKLGVVRHYSDDQIEKLKGDSARSASIGLFLGGMWIIPPVGATMTAGAAAMNKERTKNKEKTELDAVQQVRDGKDVVSVPIDYRWSTLEIGYKREIIGEETELTGADSSERVISAKQLLLKIQDTQHPSRQIKGHTDDVGSVSFTLAQTLAQATKLEPGEWKASAKWNGKWQEIGVVQVDREWIDEVVQGLREQKLQATGKSELPPAAAMSLKVSNGMMQAGAEADIALTVLNSGRGEFYRLVATTESVVSALDGLIFDFGKLASAEGLTLIRRIRIPRRQRGGRALVRFRWSELNGYIPVDLNAEIPIKAPPGY